jgi:hypothetical protein
MNTDNPTVAIRALDNADTACQTDSAVIGRCTMPAQFALWIHSNDAVASDGVRVCLVHVPGAVDFLSSEDARNGASL